MRSSIPSGPVRTTPRNGTWIRDLTSAQSTGCLTGGPHNQFLIILVYYGFPGLILLVAFYWQMVRPLWPAFLRALGQDMDQPALLAPAVIGGMIGYTFNSLLHNNGPFVGDWYHFILIGLVFALPRVLRTGQSTDIRTP